MFHLFMKKKSFSNGTFVTSATYFLRKKNNQHVVHVHDGKEPFKSLKLNIELVHEMKTIK